MKHTIPLGLLLALIMTACNIPSPADNPTPVDGSTATPDTIATSDLVANVTPIPTPTPRIRIEAGDQALFNGDYPTARDEYLSAFNSAGDAEVRASALWGLGRSEYESGNHAQSLQYLRELVEDHPNSPRAQRAHFLMGINYDTLQRYSEAATAYGTYLSLSPGLIDAYVLERQGDSLSENGDYSAAISVYQAALNAPRTGDRNSLEIKLARTYAASGDTTTALTMYTNIAAVTSNDYVKAQMDFLSGQIYFSAGQYDQAYPFFLHAVNNYWFAYDSYSALIVLDEAGITVDELNRGLCYYYANQYGLAINAFNRYEIANPVNDGTVYHFRALTLLELGLYQDAIADWTYLIDHYPDSIYWESAWERKAYTLWYYLGEYEAAAQTLLSFVGSVPNHSSAPRFLLNAARVMERDGRLSEAAAAWETLADQYPSSEFVLESLFQAGIAYYRSGDLMKSLVAFQRDMLLSSQPVDQARAYFWIGKTQQALGDATAAQSAWTMASSLDPGGYYSERARDTLLDFDLYAPPPSFDLDFDMAAERLEAEAWMRITFSLSTDTDLSSPGWMLMDERLQRGAELWELGLYDDARLEFEELRLAASENPTDCYRLVNYFHEIGLYRSAIFTARQVLTLAGLDTQIESMSAPRYFQHIRYGVYFKELVIPIAQENDLDPLFLFSVMRWESLFESFVDSSAGARGLMQIMPATGESIAGNIGWPLDFTPDDLYRPIVSLKLGAHEFHVNLLYFGGDPFASLAAYNAGLGNADIWHGLSGDDPDLYLEVVRYQETRDYLRSIYEVYAVYRTLYGSLP